MTMMRRAVRVVIIWSALAALAAPASAQVVHSFGFGGGVFVPRGFDTRVDGDVLVANLTQPELLPGVTGSLEFNIKKFRSYPIFGEWNVAFGKHLELGFGLAYQQRAVPSRYRDLVNGAQNNADIEQTLRLRVIPATAVVRFLPVGDAGAVQPYAGAGLAILSFRYAEAGEFVDTADFAIFQDRFVASGTTGGAVLLGGPRMPMGGDIYAFTIEGRYQVAKADTGGINAGFLGDRIDLGGGSLTFGFLIRY
jgi:hypothetical protein